jgi:NAD(P)-dependent dehydrogenase (short-subunit alcohol dehydrogenase family)
MFEQLQRTWTVDLKDRHIRVNVISPGTIDTGIFVGVPKEVKDQFVSIVPMGRIGQPHEIAAAALFLASDDSSFVTGIELMQLRESSRIRRSDRLDFVGDLHWSVLLISE